MKAPQLPADESQRLEDLRRYEVLDTERDLAFERLTALAAHLFDVRSVSASSSGCGR